MSDHSLVPCAVDILNHDDVTPDGLAHSPKPATSEHCLDSSGQRPQENIPENQSETFTETQLLVSVWGDVIIHSVVRCFERTGKTDTHNQMCDALVSVVIFQCDYYEQSANDNHDVVSGICRFVFENDYKYISDTRDLFLSVFQMLFIPQWTSSSIKKK